MGSMDSEYNIPDMEQPCRIPLSALKGLHRPPFIFVTGGLAVEAVLEVDELATEGLLARPVVSSSSESDDPTKAKGGGNLLK